jgi:hypothetical protein
MLLPLVIRDTEAGVGLTVAPISLLGRCGSWATGHRLICARFIRSRVLLLL